MRIEVIPGGPLEIENVSCKDGRLSGEPLFYGGGAQATSLVVRTYDSKGVLMYSGVLAVNGRTYKPTLCDRSKPVLPIAEQTTV